MTIYQLIFTPVNSDKFTAQLPDDKYLDSQHLVAEELQLHASKQNLPESQAYICEAIDLSI
jgi:hypothetical protein